VNISAGTVASGLLLPPIERIKIFSPVQWEEFILEWVHSLRSEYALVERCGGAGDMGRDIIAFSGGSDGAWDNYQAKHYAHALRPSDIWTELGKLVFYTRRGEYTYPRRYHFVAPQGAGTKLSNLLRKPEKLRQQLLEQWDSHCTTGITTVERVPLDPTLETYINSLDFSIFEAIPPLRVLDSHAKTRWHVYRFGGGLPERPSVDEPPPDPETHEAGYVRALLDAYADYLNQDVSSVGGLQSHLGRGDLLDHFRDSRQEFYSAEALRAFSRDTLPPGQFKALQDDIYSGIIDEVRSDHADGYRRLLAVAKQAKLVQITANPLVTVVSPRDRGGICHQLANTGRVRWTR
jgi:hypothetical protein